MAQPGSSDIDYTPGNFRAMLQFMAACNDQTIYEHINNVGRNSTYISSRIQNDLLDVMGASLEKKYRCRSERSMFFSLLADETTDASTKEQLTVCLRYVKDVSICERFFGFREASDLTSAGLASKLLAMLTTAGIPVSYMVGQGYDGAAAMSGCESTFVISLPQQCTCTSFHIV